MKETYKSRVYTDRPAYADFDAPRKFNAIQSIVARRLLEHPNAICSYSGGADSDIMIDVIERARAVFDLPPIKYVFFNTGLEMQATKDHVKATAKRYGVEIEEVRPEIGIVTASRKCGIPFVSKIMSTGLEGWQKKGIPLSIAEEYDQAEDKAAKRQELRERYPKCESVINFLCCCNAAGEPRPDIQLVINSSKYMRDFIGKHPPDFQISARCCDYCKKQVAHQVQKGYDMIITGERRAEGGRRSVPRKDNTSLCFVETSSGQYRLRPLYYVTDEDKAWYKEYYNIRYSDAYEVYDGVQVISFGVIEFARFTVVNASRPAVIRSGAAYAEGRNAVFESQILNHSAEDILVTFKLQIAAGYVSFAGLVAENEVGVLFVTDADVNVFHKVGHNLFSLFA